MVSKIHRLLRSCLVGHNAVVVEIPDYGQVQYTLTGVDAGDICYPFAVGPVCMKRPVEQIFVPVGLLPHLPPFPAAADLRQQIILLHDQQHSLGL